MAEVRYVVIDYSDEDYLEVGSSLGYFEFEYVAAGYVSSVIEGTANLTSAFSQTSISYDFTKATASLTSAVTVSTSASTNKPAGATLLAFNTVLSAGSRLASGVDIVLGSFSLAATAYDFTKATASLTSAVTVSAAAYDFTKATVSLTSAVTVSAAAYDFTKATASLTSAVTSTTLGVKVFGALSSITSTASVSVLASVIRSATVALSAFNTVVSAGGRIRPAVDLTAIQAILTASASMIRHGISIYQDPEAPTGIVVDGTHQTAIPGFYPPIGGDFTNNGITNETPLAITDIAFWIKNTSAQVIWSSTLIDGYASSPYTAYVFSYTGSGFSLVTKYVTSYGVDNNYPTVTTTLTWGGSLGAGWNHIYLHIRNNANELYINGQSQGAGSGVSPGAFQLSQPIILGAEQRITGDPGGSQRTYDYINTSSDFEIAQFWAGRAVVSPASVATPGAFYNTTSMSGSLGYYNLGADGHDGFNTTFDKVYFYSEFNYPYANDRLDTAGSRPTQYGANTLSTTATSDQTFIPGWTARTATTFADDLIPYYPARFRFFTQGGLLKPGQLTANSDFVFSAASYDFTKASAALISTLTITANLNYSKIAVSTLTSSLTLLATLTKLQSSTVDIISESTFSATAYDFTKASTAISTAFTLSADPDEISGGILLSLGSFGLTSNGNAIRGARTTVISVLTFTANAADKNMGLADLFTAFTISATPRVVLPVRPEAMTMSAAFSVSPTSNRFRDSLVPLASAWTFANGVTRAIKSGVVTMSAFDTVLSAGKIVEFLAENTIVVTEEQRRLRVALESTVLLVQMSNGVNTITAEPTDIVVPQEQGVLLARYNMPTN